MRNFADIRSRKILKILGILLILIQTFSCTTDIEPPPPLYNELSSSSSNSPDAPSSSGVESSSSAVQSSSSVALSSSSSSIQSSSSVVPSSSSHPPSSSSVNPSSSSCVIRDGVSGTLGYEGQNYKTIGIGCQIWMAENLNYNVSGSKCVGASGASGTLVDNGGRCGTYGRLYNWETARAVCPSGWHLPSDAEWTTFTNYVESQGGCSNCAGTRLKAISGWSSGNGTDNYSFSALPGGYGDSGGDFSTVGNHGYWWSSADLDSYYAYHWRMGYFFSNVNRVSNVKSDLLSVRCLKD